MKNLILKEINILLKSDSNRNKLLESTPQTYLGNLYTNL